MFPLKTGHSRLRWMQRRFDNLALKFKVKDNDANFVMTKAYALWLVQSGRYLIAKKEDAGALVGALFTYYLYQSHSKKKFKQIPMSKLLKTRPELIDSVYNDWSMGQGAFLQRHAVVVTYHKSEAFWTIDPMNDQETDPFSPFQMNMRAKVRKHLHLVKDPSQYAPGKQGAGLDRLIFLPGWSTELVKRKAPDVQAPRIYHDPQAQHQGHYPPNIQGQGPPIRQKIYCTHSKFK